MATLSLITAVNSFLGMKDNPRSVFYVNLPFGILAFLFTVVIVPESRDDETRHKLDAAGVVLAPLGRLVEGDGDGHRGDIRECPADSQ
jgi:hypothetical protein